MKASVSLKEGSSYHMDGEVFTSTPRDITDPGLIRKCQNVGVLAVTLHEDEPVAESKPTPAAKKPGGPPPKPPQPGTKPAPKPPVKPASAPADDKED